MPVLFLPQQIDHLREGLSESFNLPGWIWIAIAAALVFLITRIHEVAVHLVNRHFNRAVIQPGERLGEAILNAGNSAEIESYLVHGAHSALGLASASLFREEDGVFRRSAEDRGWDDSVVRTLDPRDPMLEPVRTRTRRPFGIDAKAAARNRLPDGLMRPIVGVPVGDRCRCLALALYGSHATGNDLNHDERLMLAELAERAASAFMKLDHDELRQRIAALENELETIAAKLAAGPRAPVPSKEAK